MVVPRTHLSSHPSCGNTEDGQFFSCAPRLYESREQSIPNMHVCKLLLDAAEIIISYHCSDNLWSHEMWLMPGRRRCERASGRELSVGREGLSAGGSGQTEPINLVVSVATLAASDISPDTCWALAAARSHSLHYCHTRVALCLSVCVSVCIYGPVVVCVCVCVCVLCVCVCVCV